MRKKYLISLTVLVFLASCVEQPVNAQPSAQLVDELPEIRCEVLWSRLDSFMGDISKGPDATAVIELSGNIHDLPHVDFYWYEMIRGYFLRAKLPRDRWHVLRTARREQRRAKFWLIPPGGHKPEVEEAEWSFVYPPNTKPFILTNGENYSVTGNGTCLDVDEIDLLARALEANPGAHVNVVLIVPNERAYQRLKTNTLRMLAKDYSIPASQIRMFKKVRRQPKQPWDPNAEYWYVPLKQREVGIDPGRVRGTDASARRHEAKGNE